MRKSLFYVLSQPTYSHTCFAFAILTFIEIAAHDMPEALKLEYLREIGFANMKIADGVNYMLQLLGLISRLCHKVEATGTGS